MREYSLALAPWRRVEFAARVAGHHLSHKSEYAVATKNESLRGVHVGERCFIVGNGPSLRDVDWQRLKGESLISLNFLHLGSKASYLKPDYHLISDRRFFTLDPTNEVDKAVADELTAAANFASSACFVPASEYERAVGLGVEATRLRGFVNPFYFSDYYVMSNDFSRTIPRFSSVIQTAVLLAMFLGFEEINLLGCDGTNIVATINSALDESAAGSYGIAVSSNMDSWLRRAQDMRTMERNAESFLEVLRAFRHLTKHCQARSVELWNCSSTTVVESVPRRSFEAATP